MKVEKTEHLGFRGLQGECFTLNDLTVFEGEMGIGKTSMMLSILARAYGRKRRLEFRPALRYQ